MCSKTMSQVDSDWAISDEPEILATIEHVLSVGCGKVTQFGHSGHIKIVEKCNRVHRCPECQRRFANIDKVQLLNLIEQLSNRNKRLLELLQQANQK